MTDTEAEVYAFLDKAGIEYECARHERVSSIAECALPERLLNALMPRNLFLCPRNKTGYYLLIAHPGSVFRTSSVSKQAGASRLSFADDEALGTLLHTFPGAVSPLGLMYESAKDVHLLIDRRLFDEEYLLFHPLDNTASVKLKTEDLIQKFLSACRQEYRIVELE